MTCGEDEDDAFAAAWDQREITALTRELGPVFRKHGVGRAQNDYALAERKRVAALLAQDRAYRVEERMRREAQLEIAEGKFVNLADAALGPTPEQVEQARRRGTAFRKFTPRGLDGTARTVAAYRRADVPMAYKMFEAGVITREGYSDCVWYRNLWETTGLAGNIGSIDYTREVFAAPHSRAMFSDYQVEQQDTFRAVRQHIDRRLIRLLDRMVLEDVPIYRAARSVGLGWRQARAKFGVAVASLHDAKHEIERK